MEPGIAPLIFFAGMALFCLSIVGLTRAITNREKKRGAGGALGKLISATELPANHTYLTVGKVAGPDFAIAFVMEYWEHTLFVCWYSTPLPKIFSIQEDKRGVKTIQRISLVTA